MNNRKIIDIITATQAGTRSANHAASEISEALAAKGAENRRLRAALEGATCDLERMSRLMGEYPTSLLVAKGLIKTNGDME